MLLSYLVRSIEWLSPLQLDSDISSWHQRATSRKRVRETRELFCVLAVLVRKTEYIEIETQQNHRKGAERFLFCEDTAWADCFSGMEISRGLKEQLMLNLCMYVPAAEGKEFARGAVDGEDLFLGICRVWHEETFCPELIW